MLVRYSVSVCTLYKLCIVIIVGDILILTLVWLLKPEWLRKMFLDLRNLDIFCIFAV